MMKQFLHTTLLLLTLATEITTDKERRSLIFDRKYYDIETWKEGILNLHQMVIDNTNNILYFTFDQLTEQPTSDLGYLDLNTGSARVIDGVHNAKGLAVDSVRNKVYVGGTNGLFIINEDKILEKLHIDYSIHYLFYFKDVLYIINTRRTVYKYENGTATRLKELYGINADKLIVDNDGYLYFLSNKTLSVIKLDTISIITNTEYEVETIAIDNNFKAFICTTSGIYSYNTKYHRLNKVSNITDLRELTFNMYGEAIYVVRDYILKLNDNPFAFVGQ